MLYQLLQHFDTKIGLPAASAHCDIPCKIYDPATAQIAALTVVRMMDLIAEQDLSSLSGQVNLSRLVAQKEEHVQQVKNEIRVIWGDFFKQPQFEQVPNVHDMVHGIMLQASKCSQGMDRQQGELLVNLVNGFAEAFWLVKDISTITATCPYPPSLSVVYPKLD